MNEILIPKLEWPEAITRVQSLSESGTPKIPTQYVKPPDQRPSLNSEAQFDVNIPLVDLESTEKAMIMEQVSEACREWGFFQVLNHGVRHELMDQMREIWRTFFHLPMEIKQEYANNPVTYEGYGSRIGVQKEAILDWSDYYFLHYHPVCLKNPNKWPALPLSCRDSIDEYASEVVKLCKKLMRILSVSIGLEKNRLQEAFGGEEGYGASLRVNFYPKCPEPHLTLGLSPHSDPGGMTLLLPDQHIAGLQVCKDGKWVTVKPAPHAFIVNIGDQIQVLSNAIYKSVEHRVIVNSDKERVSLALFYNPKSDILIKPLEELVSEDTPALYTPMTFDEYRLYIRTKGLHGKAQVESLQSPK
ncbi:unnamed protein product [Rhodiola kirilowii]